MPLNPAAPVQPTEDERNLAMLCHLLALILGATTGLGVVGPLIIWLWKKGQSPFIDFHAKESLNFQISLLIYLSALGILTFLTIFLLVGVLFIPVIVAVAIFGLIAEILACLAANRGEWHRYPFCLRLVA
ncbi:DUF4870 domain-containing protein [Haloferula sargassicola]|uniref:DUF4870 domain-containing protein n=1 Tax=Haloferula sargassicola TaxID=490096 RepID=A0ABP9URB2_9BACT